MQKSERNTEYKEKREKYKKDKIKWNNIITNTLYQQNNWRKT